MVVTMYVDSSRVTVNGKTSVRHLLRESYREGGKVKHRTIANLSPCTSQEVEAIRLALRHKHDLDSLVDLRQDLELRQGPSVGAVWTVYEVARRLGIPEALGDSREGRLALWQVIARVLEQGSRLSAVRLAGVHAACDVVGLDRFHEDHLYENLDWLAERQSVIEDRLAAGLLCDRMPGLFLYDVTSTYLEGVCNELGAFGYNRDGKKGKRQIVIGLLCNAEGVPLSVEVFAGNTADTATFAAQVRKAARRFGGGEVTFVGDRGMIKSRQIEDLHDHGMHYITAITKPQIEGLLSGGVIQMELFDQELAEVVETDGTRYVLRRNPIRAAEIAASRADKQRSVQDRVREQNRYLAEHPRAVVATAVRKIETVLNKLRISNWIAVQATDRTLRLEQDDQVLAEVSKLDGCYVLKTDLAPRQAGKELVHHRYKDLARVEWAFRSCKTTHLEVRPIFVRLATRTRGHAFVVMLAYRIIAELARCWQPFDLTVEEGLEALAGLCATEVAVSGQARLIRIPRPRAELQQLLEAAGVRLPEALPSRGVVVSTKRKLPERRTKR